MLIAHCIVPMNQLDTNFNQLMRYYHHIAAIELQCSSEWDSGSTFSVNMSWSVQLSCAGVESPVLFTLIPLLVDTRSGDTAAVVGYNSSLRVAHVVAAEEVCWISDLIILSLLLQTYQCFTFCCRGTVHTPTSLVACNSKRTQP